MAVNDAARHGSDVRAPMPADFCLVAHSAEGDALELAPQCPCDGAAERGLAHAGRARKAEDGPLGVGIELADAEVFKDAVLSDTIFLPLAALPFTSHCVLPVTACLFLINSF